MAEEINIENTYVETNEKYRQGCAISEHKGIYAIVAVNESKQDKKFMQWIFPKTADGVAKAEIPWQVRLGNVKQARQILQQYADMLKEIDDSSVSEMPF